jgi:TonB-linked SusC/RagA family outer membrane protein
MKNLSTSLLKKLGSRWTGPLFILNKAVLAFMILIPCIFASEIASAQGISRINGTVTDAAEGSPMPGVTVVVVGQGRGAITGKDGKYEIFNVPASASLQYSFVGKITQIVPVAGKTLIDIALVDQITMLEDVAVVGYGTQKKSNVISAMDNIKTEQLQLPTRTISTSLVGRLAGIMSVQSSGEPGNDGATFWIRGINTFAGSSAPLVLVDGVERSIDRVDSEDIADFAILKDASATALYGVRGANGVVLITTKRGQAGKFNIHLRAEHAFSSPVAMPEFVGGVEYMELINEARANGGQGIAYSRQQIENTRNKVDPYYYPDVDWTKELIRKNSPAQKVTLNVSGGSERMRYYVNAGFFNQSGMFKTFKYYSFDPGINLKRYNFRTNIDLELTGTTSLGVGMVATLENKHRQAGAGVDYIFYNMRERVPIAYPLEYPDKTKIPGEAYGQSRNPYQMLAHSGYADEYNTTLQSNIEVKQDLKFITEGLNLKFMFSFDAYLYAQVLRTMQPRPYMIQPWGFDAEGNPILTNEEGEYNYVDQAPNSATYYSYLQRTSSRPSTNRTVYLDAQLNYNRVFGLHNVGAMFLYNQNDRLVPSDENIYNSVPQRYQGITSRTTYAYNNRYFFEFNFGYNGSENFAKGKRYGFFPAVAVGWVPTEESFMDFARPAIDYLKIRFSHGQVGNDQIGSVASVSRFAYLSRIQNGTSVNFGAGANGYGSGAGLLESYYGNPDATWETATKSDLGIDIRFLNGWRLQADLFYEKREDIWVGLETIPAFVGMREVDGVVATGGNLGEMENKGVDGFIEYARSFDRGWNVSVKGTYSFARNKVLKNAKAKPVWDYQDEVGQRYNMPFGYIAERLFIDEADIQNSPDQSYLGGASKPGDIKYTDKNEDGVIDNFDQVFQGHPTVPEISYGIGASVSYRNLDLSFLFQGATNVSFYAKPQAYTDINDGNIYTYIRDNRWTTVTKDIHAKIPRPEIGLQTRNYVNSTWWLQDGSYLRLKQAELGYSLPKSWVSQIGIKHARIYANGVNLFTLSPFKLWDAESKHETGMYYPIQRVFNFGLEVNF